MTADLAAFLTAQLDLIERVARAATPGPWSYECDQGGEPGFDVYSEGVKPPTHVAVAIDSGAVPVEADATHIALHDPAFVLDWVAAQRKIVELHHPTDSSISVREDGRWVRRAICRECAGQMLPCGTLLALARLFRGRPGWRDEWDTGPGG